MFNGKVIFPPLHCILLTFISQARIAVSEPLLMTFQLDDLPQVKGKRDHELATIAFSELQLNADRLAVVTAKDGFGALLARHFTPIMTETYEARFKDNLFGSSHPSDDE